MCSIVPPWFAVRKHIVEIERMGFRGKADMVLPLQCLFQIDEHEARRLRVLLINRSLKYCAPEVFIPAFAFERLHNEAHDIIAV